MIRGFGPKKKQQRKNERKPIPFMRVSAEIQIDSSKAITESRVFLNDMNPTGVGCFVNAPIDKGERVSIFFRQPQQIFIKGEVAWCSPYNLDSKVLSNEQFKYRVGVKFIFATDDERIAVRAFCEKFFSQKGF